MFKRFCIGFILFIFCISAAQSQKLIGDSLSRKMAFKINRMAKQSLRYNDTYTAIELYELYSKKKPKKFGVKYELAQLHQSIRNYSIALALYNEIISHDPDLYTKAWFFKGQCEKNLEKYAEASVSFDEFKDRYRGLKDKSLYRKILAAEMEGIQLADSLNSHKLPVLAKSITGINNKHTESAPLFISDTLMYFSSITEETLPIIKMNDDLQSIPRLKLYEASLVDGEWVTRGLVKGEINDVVAHVSNPVIDPEGKYMYYSVCTENWQGKIICKIYQSRKVNDVWKRPEEMGFGINEGGFTSTQPAVGLEVKKNRTILYFVSDRPGGKGGLDIYYSRYNKRDEEWSKPRNAGTKINTAANEETPWYDLARGTLYFSSNGHPGIGGMDVFSSVGEMSKWSAPEIMGIPINSSSDDVYYRKQPRDRYQIIVSNRPGSLSLWNSTCCDDIYEIYSPTTVEMMIQVTAFEIPRDAKGIEDRKLLGEATTNVYLYDPKTGEKFLIRSDSMSNGFVSVGLDPGKTYVVEVEKPGFFTNSKIIDARKTGINDVISTELNLNKWDEQPITIPNIYFEFGSAELTAESKTTIDTTLFKLLIENPAITIEVAAHTDNKGTDALNMKLSQKRAESIKYYLTKKGINSDRLTGKGYGETRPIAPNSNPDGSDNPEGRAKNRRVDFTVTGTQMEINSID
jgi:OmpA-OmpF porin, OOP family